MSSEPQYQNYSQISLNAVKNTKLFQKFMQNKSGLTGNTISNISKERQSRKQPAKQQGEIVQKKWAVNKSRQVNISSNNAIVHHLKQEEHFQQRNQSKDTRLSYQDLRNSTNNRQLPTVHQVESSYVEPYKRGASKYEEKPQKVQMQREQHVQLRKREQHVQVFSNQYQNQYQENQNDQPYRQPYEQQSVQNNQPPKRRQRNFNPNIQVAKQQPHITQQTLSSSFSNKPNINQYEVPESFIKAYRPGNFPPEQLPQKKFNFYQTSGPQQRHHKPSISSGRTQNPTNYQSLAQRLPPPQQHLCSSTSTSHPLTQQQYKQKYQHLLRKHQQLKLQFKNENKNRKKQFSQWEHQIEIIKEKLFDVQSREDSLLIENQRLKDKCETQNLLKMKSQQEGKQLGYKIKELEDQLSMKESLIKQKVDQASYWKAQVDSMKQDLNTVRLTLQKRNDQYNLLYGDYQLTRKERDNKDFLLEDLRRSISSLVEQNSAAKDQLFKLVTKLYQLEQQNQVLRNDIKRQQFDSSQINSYMKDLQQQTSHIGRDRVQSTAVERPHDRYQQARMERHGQHVQRNQSFVTKEQINRSSLIQQDRPNMNMEKQGRRRGEFARERGQLTKNQKPQRDQRLLPNSQNMHNMSINEQRPHNQQKQPHPGSNKVARMNEISQELEKIKDMKAMNGAIRRRKIDLERQLQQLEGQ